MQHKSRAFTLIELLVVVLIIGILAAVAVPQYEKAVLKSRVATILPVLKTIKDAQEVFYMENGYYTEEVSELGVQLPANCSAITGGDGGLYRCGKDFVLDLDGSTIGGQTNLGKVVASYCPSANDVWTDCDAVRSFAIRFYYAQVTSYPANKLICYPLNEAGQKDCKIFGKPATSGCNSQSGCTEF